MHFDNVTIRPVIALSAHITPVGEDMWTSHLYACQEGPNKWIIFENTQEATATRIVTQTRRVHDDSPAKGNFRSNMVNQQEIISISHQGLPKLVTVRAIFAFLQEYARIAGLPDFKTFVLTDLSSSIRLYGNIDEVITGVMTYVEAFLPLYGDRAHYGFNLSGSSEWVKSQIELFAPNGEFALNSPDRLLKHVQQFFSPIVK